MDIKLLVLGITLLIQGNTGQITFPEDKLDEANEWLNQLTENNTIADRLNNLSPLSPPAEKTCVSSNQQNGVCVKKELCSNPKPAGNPTTLFIYRERNPCVTSEVCCLPNNAGTKPTDAPPTDNLNNKSGPVKPGKSCTNDKAEQGICVKKSLCSGAVQKVDSTSQFKLRERLSCHYLEACCLEKNIRAKPVKKPTEPTVRAGCGWSNPGANIFREKTSSSGFADFGEFPWMIALIKKASETSGFIESYTGGAALIHPSVVMTAAHKVASFKPNEIKVRAGEWDTQTEQEAEPHQERDVTKIIVHENYNETHALNNVGLLILKSPVDLSDAPHMGVACLAPRLPPPGTRCYSMGWGKDFLNSEKYAVILKKLQLPLVEATDCENRLKQTILSTDYVLDRSLTCAGGEKGVDTCDGDGGSPLVCPVAGQPSRFEVVGLVVYGLGCGIENIPGVYLNVPHVYNWVGNQLAGEGIDKSSFVY